MADSDSSGRVPPLPGSRAGILPGMHPYVINLRDDAKPPSGRSATHQHYSTLSHRFLRDLRQAVAGRHLQDQVVGYGEAGSLPVVTLTCTEEVAELIRGMPTVLDVYRDDDGAMGLIT